MHKFYHHLAKTFVSFAERVVRPIPQLIKLGYGLIAIHRGTVSMTDE
jgi:hypothetical protein